MFASRRLCGIAYQGIDGVKAQPQAASVFGRGGHVSPSGAKPRGRRGLYVTGCPPQNGNEPLEGTP